MLPKEVCKGLHGILSSRHLQAATVRAHAVRALCGACKADSSLLGLAEVHAGVSRALKVGTRPFGPGLAASWSGSGALSFSINNLITAEQLLLSLGSNCLPCRA